MSGLPLPLAQLARRAANAKNSLERHLAAYYLWEVAVQVLAATVCLECEARGVGAAELPGRLRDRPRPTVGQWWEIAMRFLARLAEADAADGPFRGARDLLLGDARSDFPRAVHLDALLREPLHETSAGDGRICLADLFDRLVRYRNREIGHGAAGQREADFYERTGNALLDGVGEILGRLDVLFGGRLVQIGDVRRQASGRWLVERHSLVGPTAQREESLELDEDDPAVPRERSLYLEVAGAEGPGGRPVLRALHPLAAYASDTGEFLFLNGVWSGRRGLYLCYTSGITVYRDIVRGASPALVSAVLGLARDVEPASGDAPPVSSGGSEKAAAGPAVPPVRRRIGEFELISRLGWGGMGIVYRALQPSIGRHVALKCVLGPADRRIRARFTREMRALGRVEHPNLVKIYTSGSDGDQWYYAMELVEGADLASVIDRLTGTEASEVGVTEWRAAIDSVSDDALRREEPVGSTVDGSANPMQAAADPPVAAATASPGSRPSEAAPPGGARPPSGPRAWGPDLGSRRSAPSHIAQAVRIVREAAEAAHALHEAGVIHRDIKPGNIRLSAAGHHAVLMDLGLAQLADDADGLLTRTRQFVGTLRYSSPEQVLAAANLDRRADVYSLGATLWELLALRPIFGAGQKTSLPALMKRIQSDDPGPPSRGNLRVPRDLDAIVGKCLQKDRANRYATARDLAEDLARWERGEPVEARPPTVPYLLGKYVRRHRAVFVLAGTAAILALLGAVWAFLSVESARVAAVAARAQSEVALFDLSTTMGLQSSEQGNLGRAFLWFANARGLARSDPDRELANLVRLRSWRRQAPSPVRAFQVPGVRPRSVRFDPTGAYLLVLGSQERDREPRSTVLDVAAEEELAAPSLPRDARAGAWRPDGKALALVGGEGNVAIHEIPSGAEIARIEAGGAISTVAFSGDGRLLALGGEGGVRLWDVRTGSVVVHWPHPQRVHSVEFAPGGRRILTAARDGFARVFAVPDGSEHPVPVFPPVRHDPADDMRPVFVDGGRSFVTASGQLTVARWDAETGTKLRETSMPDGVGGIVAGREDRLVIVLPRGLRLGAGAQLWDTSMPRLVDAAFRHRGSAFDAAFGPDGTRAFTAGRDGSVRIWRTPESDGFNRRPAGNEVDGRLVAEVSHPGGAEGVVASPDGRLFVTFGRGLVVVWSLEASESLDRRYEVRQWQRVCASADGRLAVFPVASGTSSDPAGVRENDGSVVRVHDLSTGAPVGPPLPTRGVALDAAFSPDGRQVATLGSRADGISDRQRAEFLPRETPGTIRLWDWAAGREVLPPVETMSEPVDAAYRPGEHGPGGGLLVVVCAAGDVVLVDPATGASRVERLERPEGRSIGSADLVRFAPDGRSFATWGLPGIVRVWDGSGRQSSVLRLEAGRAHDACFSLDGRLLAAAYGDGRAAVWDLGTSAPAAPAALPLLHSSRVASVQFSRDARYLLSVTAEAVARVWEWREARVAFPPLVHRSQLLAASFCPDERWIVTSSAAMNETGAGGALRFWERSTGRPVTPPLDGIGTEILFPSGGLAAVGCETGTLYVIDLRDFDALRADDAQPADLRLLGEILSAERIDEARKPVDLTAREWFDGWRRIRGTRSEPTALGLSDGERRDWHRRKAASCRAKEEWDASDWHLARLAALGADVEAERDALQAYVRSWRFAPDTRPWPEARAFPDADVALLASIEEEAHASDLVVSHSPRIDFGRRFPDASESVAGYAARSILSEGPRKVRVRVGSDDAVRVWLDGRLVHENLVKRTAVPDQDSVEVELAAGRNRLLVEVSNAVGPWALYLGLEDEEGRRLRLTDDDRLVPLVVGEQGADARPDGGRAARLPAVGGSGPGSP